MKKQLPLLVFSLCICCHFVEAQSTGINNTSPNPNAALDIQSANGLNQGLLIPRLKSNAKASFGYGVSDKGMIFYGGDTDSIYYWTGTKWITLQPATTPVIGLWQKTGSNVGLVTLSDNVGIGTAPSGAKFEIRGVDATVSNWAMRITNSAVEPLMTVNNAGDVAFPTLVGPGIVKTNAAGLLSVKKGNPVTGIGSPNKVAFWNTADSISYNTYLHWDNINGRLGIGTIIPSAQLHVSSTISPAFRLQDGTQAAGNLLVSDLNGNATWKKGSKYFGISGLNLASMTATITPAKMADYISFVKSDANTSIEVTMNTNAYPGVFSGGTSAVYFEIRIDGNPATFGGTATIRGVTSTEEFISCHGVFTGLAAGPHVISIYARTDSGTSTNVLLDLGGYEGSIIAKESW